MRVFFVSFWLLFVFNIAQAKFNLQVIPNADSTQNPLPVQEYEKSRQPTYESKDRPGNSIVYPNASSPLILKDPNSLELDVEVVDVLELELLVLVVEVDVLEVELELDVVVVEVDVDVVEVLVLVEVDVVEVLVDVVLV